MRIRITWIALDRARRSHAELRVFSHGRVAVVEGEDGLDDEEGRASQAEEAGQHKASHPGELALQKPRRTAHNLLHHCIPPMRPRTNTDGVMAGVDGEFCKVFTPAGDSDADGPDQHCDRQVHRHRVVDVVPAEVVAVCVSMHRNGHGRQQGAPPGARLQGRTWCARRARPACRPAAKDPRKSTRPPTCNAESETRRVLGLSRSLTQ